MIKVDSGFWDGYYAEVDAYNDEVFLRFINGHGGVEGESCFTFEGGLNLTAALVREIHGSRKPRMWESADEVPDGVKVEFRDYEYPVDEHTHTIRYGRVWVYFGSDGIAEPWDHSVHQPHNYGPFIEVL